MLLPDDPQYRRLKKVGRRGLFGTSSYWLGPDHLLIVEVSNYAERYRRFYYRDLQALVLRGTWLQKLWAVAVAGLFVAFATPLVALVLGTAQPFDDAASLGWIGTLAVLVLAALIALWRNWTRGPGCVCQAVTAVKAVNLPGIRRWAEAQRLVEAVAPLVRAAQAGEGSSTAPDLSGVPPNSESTPS